MGRDTHIFSAFFDFVIGKLEERLRQFMSILDEGIHVWWWALSHQFHGSRSNKTENGRTARSRTILQTLLLSDRFDRMTPTIGHKAWLGYLWITPAIILYNTVLTLGSGCKILETSCGKAVSHFSSAQHYSPVGELTWYMGKVLLAESISLVILCSDATESGCLVISLLALIDANGDIRGL